MRTPVPADKVRDRRSDELERRLRERLDTPGPAPRAELLHVLMLPGFDRADAIASHPTRGTGESCDGQHSHNRNLGATQSP
jgi:hypothetical protein